MLYDYDTQRYFKSRHRPSTHSFIVIAISLLVSAGIYFLAGVVAHAGATANRNTATHATTTATAANSNAGAIHTESLAQSPSDAKAHEVGLTALIASVEKLKNDLATSKQKLAKNPNDKSAKTQMQTDEYKLKMIVLIESGQINAAMHGNRLANANADENARGHDGVTENSSPLLSDTNPITAETPNLLGSQSSK